MDADRSLFPRSLAPVLREALADTPVVCLLGPRQSGKTTLVQQLAPDRAFVSLDEHNYYQTAGADPDGFVASLPEAVTVDEVQRVPVLLSAIKRAVDRDRLWAGDRRVAARCLARTALRRLRTDKRAGNAQVLERGITPWTR